MARNLNTTSGSFSDLARGNTSVVTVTGRDAFTAGDPVFLDYQLGQIVARNTAGSTEALVAGSFAQTIAHIIQQNPTACGGGTAVFGDGSYVVVNATQSTAGGDGNLRMVLTLSDKQGVLLQQQILVVSAAVAPDYGIVVGAVTSTTAAYTYRINGGNAVVVLIDKFLNVIAQSTITGATIVSFTPTSDGILIVSNVGVHKLSATGVLTQLSAINIIAVADNCTLGADIKERYVTNWNAAHTLYHRKDMFSISSGGFGIFAVTNASNTVLYHSFNSDGTTRNTITAASGLTTVINCVSASGVGGNLFWACTHGGGVTWGILSDTGTVVKAATLIGSADNSATSWYPNLTCIADANGDFLYTWSNGSGTVINTDYVVGTTGTSKSGFPRTDSTSNTSNIVRLYRLSTGIINFISSPTSAFRGLWWLVGNNGTMIKTGGLSYLTASASYSFTNTMAGTVFNDALYISYPNNSGTSTSDWVGILQKIDNTGTSTITGQSGSYPTDVMPIVFVDANDVKVFSGNWVSRYRSSDLRYLGQHFQGWTGTYPASSARFSVVKAGQQYVMTHSIAAGGNANSWVSGGIPWTMATITSGEKCVLLGVAMSSSVAGGPVMVQTKGTAPCNWTSTKLGFDQSAASPPGNVGEIVGGTIVLKGLAGT